MRMEIPAPIMVFACVALFAVSAGAQGVGGTAVQAGPPMLAKDLAVARGLSSKLRVTSAAFGSGERLNERYTQNGDNVSPPLHWSNGPLGTQAYVVLTEDSGVDRHDPIIHWVIYNIPSTMRDLSGAVPTDVTLENGAMQGKNVRGTAGYVGPRPPAGQTHPYHFEVFALNARLNLDPANANRDAVVAAMKGHVLTSGDIVANYTGK